MGLFTDFRALVWIKRMALAQERQAQVLEKLLLVVAPSQGLRTNYEEKRSRPLKPEEQVFATSDAELAQMEREEEERRSGVRFPDE